ncbi:serine hydroxymethyltransferase [Candidatus Babeliales bacterium]|nr:serine hydroxymethyltransferase [Candidatus Babeliales bacterium]MCF7899677.1 serine hydroxymethyltransferase [Candidatus Babeliales bacterium]
MQNYIFELIKEEKIREEKTINLIASENYASPEILQATGSILTNKYAEGYPGARYYGGCQVVDKVETYAIDMCKKLFNAEHANVQPHSGSSANFGVYFSQLKPGDTVLGMALNAGGHLTHGHKINFSGSIFNFVPYGLSPETEQLDYDEIEILAQQHKPKIIVAGASAYSRTIDFEKLHKISTNNNCLLLVDMAHIAGLIAAELHPSPIPFADFISSTTHKTLRGPRSGFICCKAEFAQKIDKAIMPGIQGGPLMHVIAAKAIAFEQAQTKEFKKYQEQVIKNAKAMAQTFTELGYRVVSGGTDNHLFLIDLQDKNKKDNLPETQKLSGKVVEQLLQKCNIILNRNTIPFDTQPPTNPSGIRIGTPAITTRGFVETHACSIVHFIDDAIKNRFDDDFLNKLKIKVEQFCKNFPIYKD